MMLSFDKPCGGPWSLLLVTSILFAVFLFLSSSQEQQEPLPEFVIDRYRYVHPDDENLLSLSSSASFSDTAFNTSTSEIKQFEASSVVNGTKLIEDLTPYFYIYDLHNYHKRGHINLSHCVSHPKRRDEQHDIDSYLFDSLLDHPKRIKATSANDPVLEKAEIFIVPIPFDSFVRCYSMQIWQMHILKRVFGQTQMFYNEFSRSRSFQDIYHKFGINENLSLRKPHLFVGHTWLFENVVDAWNDPKKSFSTPFFNVANTSSSETLSCTKTLVARFEDLSPSEACSHERPYETLVAPYVSNRYLIEGANKLFGVGDDEHSIDRIFKHWKQRSTSLYFRGNGGYPGYIKYKSRRFLRWFQNSTKIPNSKIFTFEKEHEVELYQEELFASEMLDSQFCFYVRGDTYSSRRFYDIISSGCIPLMISSDDNAWLERAAPYKWLIDYNEMVVWLDVKDFPYEYKAISVVKNTIETLKKDEKRVKSMLSYANRVKKFLLWNIGNPQYRHTQPSVLLMDAILRIGDSNGEYRNTLHNALGLVK